MMAFSRRTFLRRLFFGCMLTILMSQGRDVYAQFSGGPNWLKAKVVLDHKSKLIRSLAFTSDDKQLGLAPQENNVWMFDAATGAKGKEIPALRGPSTLLVAGPRSDTMYCMENLAMRLVNVNTGVDVSTYGSGSGTSAGAVLSPRKDVLAFASASGGVELVDANLRESLVLCSAPETPKTSAEIRSSAAALSSDGRLVAGGRPNGRIYLWSVSGRDAKSIHAFLAHERQVDGLQFTGAGLLSLGRDGKLNLWNVDTAKQIGNHSFDSELTRGWMLPDGRLVAITRKVDRDPLKMYAVSLLNERFDVKYIAQISAEAIFGDTLAASAKVAFQGIAISHDGKLLAVACKSEDSGEATAKAALFDISSFAALSR